MTEQRKPEILIVDDEPEILQSLFGLLRREFNLHVAESGEQALQILDEHPIEVVMTDQRMPGMSGVELMAKVREKYPDALRIVFTGYADIKAVIEAINSGGLYRYLTKPWDPDELVDVLHHAALKFRQVNEQKQLLSDIKGYISSTNVNGDSGDARDAAGISVSSQELLDRLDRIFELV